MNADIQLADGYQPFVRPFTRLYCEPRITEFVIAQQLYARHQHHALTQLPIGGGLLMRRAVTVLALMLAGF